MIQYIHHVIAFLYVNLYQQTIIIVYQQANRYMYSTITDI